MTNLMKKLCLAIINIVLAFLGLGILGCICGIIMLVFGKSVDLFLIIGGFIGITLFGGPLVSLKDKLTNGDVNTMKALMKELCLATIALVTSLFGIVALFLGWHAIESLVKGRDIKEVLGSVLGVIILCFIAFLLSRLKNKLSGRNSSEDL